MQQARLALMTYLFPRYRLVDGLVAPIVDSAFKIVLMIQSINELIIKMTSSTDFAIAEPACNQSLRFHLIIFGVYCNHFEHK